MESSFFVFWFFFPGEAVIFCHCYMICDRLDQWMVLIICLNFQVVSMVVLVTARAAWVGFVCSGGSSAEDRSPIIHSDRERGILQPSAAESFCASLDQKHCISGQSHKVCSVNKLCVFYGDFHFGLIIDLCSWSFQMYFCRPVSRGWCQRWDESLSWSSWQACVVICIGN